MCESRHVRGFIKISLHGTRFTPASASAACAHFLLRFWRGLPLKSEVLRCTELFREYIRVLFPDRRANQMRTELDPLQRSPVHIARRRAIQTSPYPRKT